jgi:hypothetical protein
VSHTTRDQFAAAHAPRVMRIAFDEKTRKNPACWQDFPTCARRARLLKSALALLASVLTHQPVEPGLDRPLQRTTRADKSKAAERRWRRVTGLRRSDDRSCRPGRQRSDHPVRNLAARFFFRLRPILGQPTSSFERKSA